MNLDPFQKYTAEAPSLHLQITSSTSLSSTFPAFPLLNTLLARVVFPNPLIPTTEMTMRSAGPSTNQPINSSLGSSKPTTSESSRKCGFDQRRCCWTLWQPPSLLCPF
ncbi:hypothetical protein JHK87_022996 [Glycine soja]|uniref:Uncharacterized protein n=1 Tax=Glycine max TaxID=3847 RepID=A0A0R0J576_SOYBN|nr:hypothetical protein JHK87_022996 [Glycine soja]